MQQAWVHLGDAYSSFSLASPDPFFFLLALLWSFRAGQNIQIFIAPKFKEQHENFFKVFCLLALLSFFPYPLDHIFIFCGKLLYEKKINFEESWFSSWWTKVIRSLVKIWIYFQEDIISPAVRDHIRMNWSDNFMFLFYRILTTKVEGQSVILLLQSCRRGI